MGTKKCNLCDQIKPIELFGISSRSKDGRDWYCKPCRRLTREKYAPVKRHYEKRFSKWTKEYKREYALLYARNNPEKITRYRKTSRERIKSRDPGYFSRVQLAHRSKKRNRIKYNVRVRAYTRKERLMDRTCSMCGTTDNLQMHHPDYKQPYLVVTLCRACHGKVHRKRNILLTSVT